MPLLPCPECKNEVSSLATVCPRCGYPIAKLKEAQQQVGETHTNDEALRLSIITKRTQSKLCVLCGEKISMLNKKVEMRLKGDWEEPGLFYANQQVDIAGVSTPWAHGKCAERWGSEGTREGRRLLISELFSYAEE